MILARYAEMRAFFAIYWTVTGAANNGAGLIRLTFQTTIFATGDRIRVDSIKGTTEANGVWTITVIDGTHADMQGSTFSNAYISGGNVTKLWRDGFPVWPGPMLDAGDVDNTNGFLSLLRRNGFSATFLAQTAGGFFFPQAGPVGPICDPDLIPSGQASWPLVITCNDGLPDAVVGVHDYDWYAALRRDVGLYPQVNTDALEDFNSQAFTVAITNPTHSGTITLTPNLGPIANLLPGKVGADLFTAESWAVLFKNVLLFVRRRSDGSIQWCSVYEPPAVS